MESLNAAPITCTSRFHGFSKRTSLLLLFSLAMIVRAGEAQRLALNDGFEMESTLYWNLTGSLPSTQRGVYPFDVTGNGKPSWAYYQHPGDGYSGGLEQTLYVIAGVTYVVHADFCYHNC